MPTNNNINTGKPIEVPPGGTQKASVNAYSVLCGGTTTTGALQTVASNGTVGQILTSQGASALPVWSSPASGAWVLVQTLTASNSSTIDFTSGINGTYNTYMMVISNITESAPGTLPNAFVMQYSSDGGASYYASGYTTRNLQSTYSAGVNWQGFGRTDSIQLLNTVTQLSIPNNIVFYLFEVTSGNGPIYLSPGLSRGGLSSRAICLGAAYYSPATIMNALRFKIIAPGGENILTGTFSLYGLKQ